MPHDHDVDMLLNDLVARLMGGLFLGLLVALAVVLVVVGTAGILRTRRRHVLV